MTGCASSHPETMGASDASHNYYRQPDDTVDTQSSLYGVQPPYGPGSDVPGEVNHD